MSHSLLKDAGDGDCDAECDGDVNGEGDGGHHGNGDAGCGGDGRGDELKFIDQTISTLQGSSGRHAERGKDDTSHRLRIPKQFCKQI